MNADVVISCPRCLRQYSVGPSMNGKPGMCFGCKARFTITAVSPSPSEDVEPVVLTNDLQLEFNFLREACDILGGNCFRLLELAGKPAAISHVISIVDSLPRVPGQLADEDWRRRPCSKILELAHYHCMDTPEEPAYRELLDYFVKYLPTRSFVALDTLQAAFVGVLGVVERHQTRTSVVGEACVGEFQHSAPRHTWRLPWARKGGRT